MNTKMKMLMILCSGSQLATVQELLDAHDLHGYSEIAEIRGAGRTGKHFGTRAWPGTSNLIFAAIEEPKVDEVVGAIGKVAETCPEGEGIHLIVLPVDRMV